MTEIINAGPGFSVKMNKEEIIDFLFNNKLILHLGSLDNQGHPNVHPVWFYFDKKSEKIYFNTSRHSKKFLNLSDNPVVYYCIDSNEMPYKGVRAKGTVKLLENLEDAIPIASNILIKYLGNLKNPMAMMILDLIRKRNAVIFEITSHYYSTWDDGKIDWENKHD